MRCGSVERGEVVAGVLAEPGEPPPALVERGDKGRTRFAELGEERLDHVALGGRRIRDDVDVHPVQVKGRAPARRYERACGASSSPAHSSWLSRSRPWPAGRV